MEERFNKMLRESRKLVKSNSVHLTKRKYTDIIAAFKTAKQKKKKDPVDYKILKKFDILTVGGVEKLIDPIKKGSGIKYYVHDDEVFEILSKVHDMLGHVGRDKMMKELKKKYRNITYKDILLFLSLCQICGQKYRKRKEVSAKKLRNELNSRCNCYIIDFQMKPDDEFNFILYYEDDVTKFCVIKALKTNKIDEIVNNLIDIFTLMGAPIIFNSINGRAFGEEIIRQLNVCWPQLKMVSGIECQDSTEQFIEEIKTMVSTWMQEHNTLKWYDGLKFVQLQRNQNVHPLIQKTPYETLFGHSLHLGLCTLNIPKEITENIQYEEELKKLIESVDESESESLDNDQELDDLSEQEGDDQTNFIFQDILEANQLESPVSQHFKIKTEEQAKRPKKSKEIEQFVTEVSPYNLYNETG